MKNEDRSEMRLCQISRMRMAAPRCCGGWGFGMKGQQKGKIKSTVASGTSSQSWPVVQLRRYQSSSDVL
eukprot:2215762-Rhodomonas_salina.6